MAECRRLKRAALATLTAAGWTTVSGPHDTEAECTATCSGTATSSGSGDTGYWWAASSPGGEQSGGDWYSGEN